MVSGFVTSVKGLVVSGKVVVVAKVRHSQRMNDPLIPIWIITEEDGTILSAHCMGCKAGLSESCSHVASVLFYIEAWTRINGRLACTQVKCTWLLPTFVKEVNYERVQDINFKSAVKLKEELDDRINVGEVNVKQTQVVKPTAVIPRPTAEELSSIYEQLNKCKVKPVCLSLVEPYAEQFVCKSREISTISDLYDPTHVELNYADLIKKCHDVDVKLSEEEIDHIEKDTRNQAKCSGFFKHRAGRIGASLSGAVCHTNPTQPSQSLIKTIVYPDLYNINTKPTRHGCKEESNAVKAYGEVMKDRHKNFDIKNCGVMINKEHQYIHATPDFLTSCDCCGLGCGEVKCPLVDNCNLDDYVSKKNSCLEKVGNTLRLKRNHNYYYQVQQQLFTTKRKFCDFVVYLTDSSKDFILFQERIFPDLTHWQASLPTLRLFWTICILPEVLSRWYTRRCDIVVNTPTDDCICFCRMPPDCHAISCSNIECPYGEFHLSCLGITANTPKAWLCPHCSRLPQFKRKKTKKTKQSTTIKPLAVSGKICICNSVPTANDRLLECHNQHCANGKFFHLDCIGYKRMPNNSKTTWQCAVCRNLPANTTTCTSSTVTTTTPTSATPNTTTCTSSPHTTATAPTSTTPNTACTSLPHTTATAPTSTTSSTGTTATVSKPVTIHTSDSDSESEDEVEIIKVSVGQVNKTGTLANLSQDDLKLILNPNGWLHASIIQQAQVLLKNENPLVEGLQKPTLGRVRNFDVVSGEFVQILHTGRDHWVCISSIGCLPGMVHLFDSLYNDVITQEVEEQTKDIMAGDFISIDYVPVQQQNNGSDCGVFAIAVATCLVFGIDPKYVTFDITRMRPHLVSCLQAEKIDLFPCF